MQNPSLFSRVELEQLRQRSDEANPTVWIPRLIDNLLEVYDIMDETYTEVQELKLTIEEMQKRINRVDLVASIF